MMLAHALRYAGFGLPVFPLATGTKIPLAGSNGLHDATTDPDVIREWWGSYSRRNVSVLTGEQTGLLVLDVDAQHGGLGSIILLQREHGRLPKTAIVATPSGGWHVWFRWPSSGVDIRNSVERVGRGLDIRANGGSIIAPPSVILNKGSYRWLTGEPNLLCDLAEPPEWLWRAALRTPLPPVEPRGPVRCESAYAKAILDREIAALAQTPPGGRNNALNRCAWNIGKLVKAGLVAEGDARSAVLSRAIEIGLHRSEAAYTIARTFQQAPAKIIA